MLNRLSFAVSLSFWLFSSQNLAWQKGDRRMWQYWPILIYCNRLRVGLVFMNYRVVFEPPSWSALFSCLLLLQLCPCQLSLLFLNLGSNDVLVKLTVSARELTKEQQEKIDEILQLHVQLYTKNHKLSSPNGVRAFVQHITRAYNLAVESVEMGSLIITVKCPTLESLERLWSDYQSGCLDDIAEMFLLTTDIKSKLDLDIVRFKITIEEENYLACKKALSGKLSNFSEAFEAFSKTSNWEIGLFVPAQL